MFFYHLLGPGLFLLLGLSRIFWFVLLIGAVLFLVNALRTRTTTHFTYPYPQGTQPQQMSAMETLRQRYARGEIDGATFDHMRERLEGATQQQQQ